MTMKRYVKEFEQQEPAIFRIHCEQLNVFLEFLIDFVKPEVITQNKDVRWLRKVNFHLTGNHLLKTMVSVDSSANKILKKS